MKSKLYLIVVGIAFLMGILHLTLALVLSKELNADTLWSLGTGLALLFYSALNLIHIRHGAESDIRLIVRVTNVLMLLFMALSVPALGVKGNPQVVVLVVTGILMLGLSFSKQPGSSFPGVWSTLPQERSEEDRAKKSSRPPASL